MGMFDGMNDAENNARTYFQTGNYVVEIEIVKAIEAHESYHGVPSFIVECKVIESSCAQLPAGTCEVGWVVKIVEEKMRRALAQAEIKSVLAAVMRDEDLGGTPSEKLAPIAAGEANPFKGFRCGLQCTQKKVDGFTKHRWFALPADSPHLQRAAQ